MGRNDGANIGVVQPLASREDDADTSNPSFDRGKCALMERRIANTIAGWRLDISAPVRRANAEVALRERLPALGRVAAQKRDSAWL